MNENNFSCQVCFSKKLMVARYPAEDNNGILILESSPFPSYYSVAGFPDSLKSIKDHHLYLLVKNPFHCFQDRIFRYSYKLKKKLGLTLHVSPGQISYLNETFLIIRVRTDETAQLKPFIETFKDLGIHFMKDTKVRPYRALIQYKKYTTFEKIDEGIFKDSKNTKRYFIQIPMDIDFDIYERMINDIKNNCDFHLFDHSLVYLHCGDDFLDMASIYSDHCVESRLPEFRRSLNEEIKRLNLDPYGFPR